MPFLSPLFTLRHMLRLTHCLKGYLPKHKFYYAFEDFFLTNISYSVILIDVIVTLFTENIYLIYITIFKYIFHIKFWSCGPLIIMIMILVIVEQS